VESRTVLLSLHLVGVAAWLGANFVQLLVVPRMERAGTAVAVAWHETAADLSKKYYSAAGALVGVTGVLLVLDDRAEWSSGFVWVGIAAVAIGAFLGIVVFGPKEQELVAAHRSGDSGGVVRTLRTIRTFAVVDTLVVLLAVVAMVDHWQA
jgi:hypothetical protein